VKGFVESVRCELRAKSSPVHITMVQLPGLNTPQFEHCRSKLPKHPKPVAPVFQPELAANAVHWAAHHRRREVYVGFPTLYTIAGSKLAPWLLERYLAKTAVTGQQADEPPSPLHERGNLFEPVDTADPGARGPFDDEARERSLQWLASRHRRTLAGAAAASLVIGGLLARQR
jgi:hypothetical protein